MAHGYPTIPRRDCTVTEHCRRQRSCAGYRGLLGGDNGALLVPSPFWTLPTIFLSGPAAAASIALINATGNLGGFAGPYLIGYLADLTGGYTAGLMYLISCGVLASGLILSLRTTRPKA